MTFWETDDKNIAGESKAISRAVDIHELFSTPSQILRTLRKEVFENFVGKGENAVDQHLLLFLDFFSNGSFNT